MSKKRQDGWAAAHVGSLLEDGLAARKYTSGEVPVELVWCAPEDAGFLMKFDGVDSKDDIYFYVSVRAADKDGELL